MKIKTLIRIITGIVMFAFLSKAFSMTSPSQVDDTLKQREIQFSAAKLQFSMPENFSLDFPAEDMVDQVNERDSRLYEKNNNTKLLQRWWDFFEPTFFSKKEVATIMMTITIHQSGVIYKSRLDFVKILLNRLELVHKEFNETAQPDFQILYPETYESFFEEVYNQQRWLGYSLEAVNGTSYTATYVMPLDSSHYVEIAFDIGISHNIRMRDFYLKDGQNFIEKIMSSTALKFQELSMQKFLGVDVDSSSIKKLVSEMSN